MLSVNQLEWDSEFFGFGVGRLAGSFSSVDTLSNALRTAAKGGLRLVYGECDHRDTISRDIALAVGGRLVDMKRTYTHALNDIQSMETATIEEASNDPLSCRHIRSLAWQAAQFSRFRSDSSLPAGSWRRMYSLWADNSLNGMLADAVLVERAEGRIVGMITVKYRGEIGQIGLFSVDQMYRGRRIGSRLLNVAMKRCHAGGCKQILVVTQRQNSASCRFYERVGFHVTNEQAVFHFWVGQT